MQKDRVDGMKQFANVRAESRAQMSDRIVELNDSMDRLTDSMLLELKNNVDPSFFKEIVYRASFVVGSYCQA